MMKMLSLRGAGLFTVFTVIALGVTTCALEVKSMWYFPMANTIVWLHYTELLREPITPVTDSFIYFTATITAVLIADLTILQRLQFISTGQEE